WIGPGHQERPTGILPKAKSEMGALAELLANALLDLLRADPAEQVERGLVDARQPEQYAIVVAERGDGHSETLTKPCAEDQLERMVKFAAERRQDGQAHVAGRVSKGLEENRPVIGYAAGETNLAGHVIAKCLRGGGLEPAFATEPVENR